MTSSSNQRTVDRAPRAAGSLRLALGLLLVVSGGAACGDGILEMATERTLLVSAATTGEDPDPDGYVVIPEKGHPVTLLDPTGSARLELEEGEHRVELTAIAENCAVEGENPAFVRIVDGELASIHFDVSCRPAGTE